MALLVALGALVAGCGSSGGSSSGTTAAGGSTEAEAGGTEGEAAGGEAAAGGNGVAEAKKYVAEHSDLESLKYPEPPDEPYDPGHGKAAVIACGTAGAGCLAYSKAAVTALKAAGWEASEIQDGKFTPTVQAGLIQHDVQEGYEAIVMVAVNPASVEAGIAAAEKAHVPISCVSCVSVKGFPGFGGRVSMASSEEVETGESIGNVVVAGSGGKATVVQFVDHAYENIVVRAKAAKEVVEERCPECTYEEIGFATEELTEPGPPSFSAYIAAHPETEWAMLPSDSYSIPMVKTAEQSGNPIKFSSSDAEGAYLTEMVNGENAVSTVWQPIGYISWSGVDNALRQVAGLKPWNTTEMPSALVDQEMAPTLLKAQPNSYSPPAFDYEALYKKLWSGK